MKPSLRNLAGMLVLALTVVWFGGSAWATNLPDTWSPLKQALFGDRPLQEGMIQLEAPEVAQDAATVPVSITIDAAQSAERFVKTLHLIVDRNPIPIAAIFHLTPESGRANLSTRIRLQTYSHVRGHCHDERRGPVYGGKIGEGFRRLHGTRGAGRRGS